MSPYISMRAIKAEYSTPCERAKHVPRFTTKDGHTKFYGIATLQANSKEVPSFHNGKVTLTVRKLMLFVPPPHYIGLRHKRQRRYTLRSFNCFCSVWQSVFMSPLTILTRHICIYKSCLGPFSLRSHILSFFPQLSLAGESPVYYLVPPRLHIFARNRYPLQSRSAEMHEGTHIFVKVGTLVDC